MRDPKWISSLLTQSPFGLDTHFLLTLITKSLIYILLIAIQQQSIWFSLFNVVHWLICLLTCYNNVSFTVFHNVVLDGLRNLYNFKSTDFRPQSLSYPLVRGTLGGYPIPQYRTKNLLIPKYCVENLRNTDTAFMIGDAYLTLYPSRVFFFFFFISSMYIPEINLILREQTWEDLELIGTTIEKPGHWMFYQFHHRVTV